MKQVLTDISIWVGVILGALTIFDWLLNDRQKDHLRRFGEDLWLWLADQKSGKFIQAFTGYKVQLLISVTVWGIFNVLNMMGMYIVFSADAHLSRVNQSSRLLWEDLPTYIYMFVCFVFVSWKIHPPLLAWITQGASVGRFFSRCGAAVAICLLMIIGIVIYIATSIFLIAMILPLAREANTFAFSQRLLLPTFIAAFMLIIPVGAEFGLLYFVVLLSAIWCAVVYIAIGMIRTFQFVLLRIVDNPKGPVLGLSGLLVGVAALVKAFL
jgi:hypothetical protein